MDRQIVYPGAIPLETDLLNTNKNTMIGLAKLAAGVLGANTFLNGLTCIPDSPASLNVNVGAGEIYSLQNIDATAYSSLAADTTHSILKQGIRLDGGLLSCPAPGTTGQSINYLIQVTYQEIDTGATVLPYYNSSNPSQAYSGPANAGTAQNTVRTGVCTVAAKAGVPATTGSQTTPAPDAGYTGAYVVTVAYGQTQITAPNITTYAGAPFLPAAGLVIGGLQGAVCTISAAGGTSDAITGSYTPGIATLTNGMSLFVRATAANATKTPTFTPNSGVIAAKTIVKGPGVALAVGDIAGGGHWIELQYDLTFDKWILLNPASPISVTQTILGSSKKLDVTNTVGATNNKLSITADELILKNSAGAAVLMTNVSVTADITVSGAGGLDTGSETSNIFYYAWVIWNGTTVNGLLSTSSTAPTMPSGYTHSALVSFVRNDGSSNFLQIHQRGDFYQFKTQQQVLSGGTSGTWVSISTTAVVPPIAKSVQLLVAKTSGTAAGQYTGSVAPNNSGTGAQLNVIAYTPNTTAQTWYGAGELMLEWPENAGLIYYTNSGGGGNTSVYINGMRLAGIGTF